MTPAENGPAWLDATSQVQGPVPWWHSGPGRSSLAALMLFTLGYALRLARPLLLPLVVACLLAIVLAPIVRRLRAWHLPYPLAAAIVVLAFTAATGLGVYSIADPATSWIERAPETMREIERKLRTVKASMLEARQAADTVEEMTRVDGDAPPTEVTVKEPSLAARVVAMTQAALMHALEVILLLYFLLAFGDSTLRKVVMLSPRLRAKIQVVKITAEIEEEISGYLFTVACINAGLGAATTLAMSVLGMPNPVLWGVVAAVLNFVPYLGSAVTLVVLTLVAILTFDTLPRALLVPAAFLFLATMEGQFVNPIIVGRKMSLSPLAIVIALMAGAWIWGPVGLLIAVPVLAMVKIYCSHQDELAPVAELLGGE
jgi:predicted PurR-regulated permease PerM